MILFEHINTVLYQFLVTQKGQASINNKYSNNE